MKRIFSLIMFVSIVNIYAQDKIYLDKKYKKTDQKELALYYRLVRPDPEDKKLVSEQTFFMDGKIKYERKYLNYSEKKKILVKNMVWYENGQIHLEGNYSKGKKDGFFISYWENGQFKRKDLYKKDRLKEGKCWNNSGKEVAYYDFEIQPEFPGGKNALVLYLKMNINYDHIPASSKGQSVKVRFTVASEGLIEDVKVVKGIDAITDFEAKRVIQNMPKWKPAIQDGKRVKVGRTLPLTF